MPVLTLSMIVKNEEKYLRDCLESVKDAADEIVIVDTGSTDKTLEIAREYGAKIFSFEWINDFSAARNYALTNSTGDWILYLDADERLSPSSIDELKRIVSSNKLQGVNCTVSSLDEETKRPNVMRYVRLFRNNPNIRFEGCVHEQISASLKRNKYLLVESGVEIIHLGYNISSGGLKDKARRNLQILLNEYNKTKSAYYEFQLGQTYSVLCDLENALKYFRLAVLDKKLENSSKAHSYRFMAAFELEKGNFTEASGLIKKALEFDSSSAIINYLASQIFLALQDFRQADYHCRRALEFNSSFKTGKRRSSFDFIIDESVLLFLGLNISVLNNMPGFDYYFSRLSTLASADQNLKYLYDFIGLLKNKMDVDPKILQDVCSLLNEYNIELILNLISAYENPKIRLSILPGFESRLSGNSKYLFSLGEALHSAGEIEKAILYLERSLSQPVKYPPALFYLITAYVQLNRLDKLPDLISFAEENFSLIPEVNQRLDILKQKLAPYLK